MPKKMRILFALFITLPLILSVNPGYYPGYPPKSGNFRNYDDLKQKQKDFMTKTKEEKDKILKELDSSISDLNKKIKKYIAEKDEYPNEDIMDLMNKIIEINNYMEAKVCNKRDNNYKNCVNEKKILMKNLLFVVEDNFRNCAVTLEHITKLTNSIISNLSLLCKLIEFIIINVDYIENTQADIISNILSCVGDKMGDLWPAISDQIEEDGLTNVEYFIKEYYLEALLRYFVKINILKERTKIKPNTLREVRREDIYKEIFDVLKEVRESKNDKTLIIIIISCLATIILLVGGFFLYRFIRRKNSNLIENTKDLVASENK